MGDQRWFIRDEREWASFAERLKQTACPHCKVVGTLNRHGSLHGFDDSTPPRKALRARRVYCSNRHRRRGCGRTVSVWLADKIRRLSLGTRKLLAFLQRAVAGTLAEAIRVTGTCRSPRTFERLWKRFDLAQSAIRTALSSRGPPPAMPSAQVRRPAAAQVLAHLHATFAHANCPIAAYQMAMRAFFV